MSSKTRFCDMRPGRYAALKTQILFWMRAALFLSQNISQSRYVGHIGFGLYIVPELHDDDLFRISIAGTQEKRPPTSRRQVL